VYGLGFTCEEIDYFVSNAESEARRTRAGAPEHDTARRKPAGCRATVALPPARPLRGGAVALRVEPLARLAPDGYPSLARSARPAAPAFITRRPFPCPGLAGLLSFITVKDFVALEIADNLKVGRQDPNDLLEIYRRLRLKGVDALVLSACVQMPSLPAIARVQAMAHVPVASAAVCTTYRMLKSLGIEARVPEADELLSGRY
jgi:hypothetical protein